MELIIMIINMITIILSVISLILGVLFLVTACYAWITDPRGEHFDLFLFYLGMGICALWLGIIVLLHAIGIFPLSEWETWRYDE